ncbi:MAG: dihydroorotate dehydrogenase [Actinomycetia bacterium]|nr:dihydroorotate dehydrogenase [Actinomycetes bacterium]
MRRKRLPAPVDPSVTVGSTRLRAGVMTASGTAGHGDELGAHMDLSDLGAVVVKSMMAGPWEGNPGPRVHPTPSGMINSVGLQGAGIEHWRREELPALEDTGATVVVSIWGRHLADYERAAEALADLGDTVAAVEVNLSCPNLDGGSHLFAHDPDVAAGVIEATAAAARPRWAKLSANTDRVVEVAAAVAEAGADAVTLINTLKAMVIDIDEARPVLGARAAGGGLSGAAIGPVALRTVFDVHAALPELAIVGVGGVTDGRDAVAMMMAGASAVQVGTATFADPRSADTVRRGLEHWCATHGIDAVADLKGMAHGRD